MVRNQYLVWGITLILGGCSLGIPPPRMVIGGFNPIPYVVEIPRPTIIPIVSGSSPATSISSDDSSNSGAISQESKKPSGSGKPQQNVPAPLQQQKPAVLVPEKPAVLVPEIPDQNNGEAVGAYKSKIEETQSLLRTINESQLTKEKHDTFISIHSFLEKAQEAFSQDDMSMALNLVEKAHTLTKEIVKNAAQQ